MSGAKTPTASFSSGNNFASIGRAAGARPPTACAAFTGIAFNTPHDNFTAGIIRIGINYWFGYWGQ
jgi:hypothetical protein